MAAINSAVTQSAEAIRTFSGDLIAAQHASSPLGRRSSIGGQGPSHSPSHAPSPLGRTFSGPQTEAFTPPRQALPKLLSLPAGARNTPGTPQALDAAMQTPFSNAGTPDVETGSDITPLAKKGAAVLLAEAGELSVGQGTAESKILSKIASIVQPERSQGSMRSKVDHLHALEAAALLLVLAGICECTEHACASLSTSYDASQRILTNAHMP